MPSCPTQQARETERKRGEKETGAAENCAQFQIGARWDCRDLLGSGINKSQKKKGKKRECIALTLNGIPSDAIMTSGCEMAMSMYLGGFEWTSTMPPSFCLASQFAHVSRSPVSDHSTSCEPRGERARAKKKEKKEKVRK